MIRLYMNVHCLDRKMKTFGALTVLSLVLGVCECANIKNATLVMVPDAVDNVSLIVDGHV